MIESDPPVGTWVGHDEIAPLAGRSLFIAENSSEPDWGTLKEFATKDTRIVWLAVTLANA